MVTIKDIAREAGVSYSTVSCVLNGKAKQVRISERAAEKVQTAAQKLGYQRNEIARSIVTGKSKVIGFLVPNIASEHCARILAGVMNKAAENDYFVKILKVEPENTPENIAAICSGQRFDGVVCHELASTVFAEQLHLLLARKKIPMAITGGSYSIKKGIHITPNNEMGGRLVFEHLYALGHRRFFIPFAYCSTSWANERVAGFLSGLRDAGLKLADKYISKNVGSLRCKNEDLKRFFTGREQPTAVFCLSDYEALYLLTEFSRIRILVPKDISLTGYGNLNFVNSCTPKITSIEEQLIAVGSRAVEVVLQEITTSEYKSFYEETVELFDVKLIVRESTKHL